MKAEQIRSARPSPCMKDLPIYLNDHLAGSIGAIEMIEDLIDTHQGRSQEDFLKASGDDIRNDQRELQRLMRALRIEQSTMRKAVAWVADKASRLRLRLADFGEPNLALLQSLKTLSVGLWENLCCGAHSTPRSRQEFGEPV